MSLLLCVQETMSLKAEERVSEDWWKPAGLNEMYSWVSSAYRWLFRKFLDMSRTNRGFSALILTYVWKRLGLRLWFRAHWIARIKTHLLSIGYFLLTLGVRRYRVKMGVKSAPIRKIQFPKHSHGVAIIVYSRVALSYPYLCPQANSAVFNSRGRQTAKSDIAAAGRSEQAS